MRHVVNITDVGHAVADSDTGEDKLEVAAAKERRSVEEIAEFYTQDWLDALAALNVQPADVYPRASAYVDQMIEFAKVLEDKGYTYQLPSGLYFDTSKSPGYGTLALLDLAGQRETGRVEHVEGRKLTATSRCGAPRSRASGASCAGTPRGAGARPAGTWNAR